MALRFGSAIREFRIHLCQTSPHSEGVRQFIKSHYVSMKKENPGFPILIRECNGAEPRVYARYAKGVEKSATLKDASAETILGTIKQLAMGK